MLFLREVLAEPGRRPGTYALPPVMAFHANIDPLRGSNFSELRGNPSNRPQEPISPASRRLRASLEDGYGRLRGIALRKPAAGLVTPGRHGRGKFLDGQTEAS